MQRTGAIILLFPCIWRCFSYPLCPRPKNNDACAVNPHFLRRVGSICREIWSGSGAVGSNQVATSGVSYRLPVLFSLGEAYVVGRRWTYKIQVMPASPCLPGPAAPPATLTIMQVRVKDFYAGASKDMLQYVYLYGTVRPWAQYPPCCCEIRGLGCLLTACDLLRMLWAIWRYMETDILGLRHFMGPGLKRKDSEVYPPWRDDSKEKRARIGSPVVCGPLPSPSGGSTQTPLQLNALSHDPSRSSPLQHLAFGDPELLKRQLQQMALLQQHSDVRFSPLCTTHNHIQCGTHLAPNNKATGTVIHRSRGLSNESRNYADLFPSQLCLMPVLHAQCRRLFKHLSGSRLCRRGRPMEFSCPKDLHCHWTPPSQPVAGYLLPSSRLPPPQPKAVSQA